MFEIYVLIASLCLLPAVWFVARKKTNVRDSHKEESLVRLEEVIKASQLTNDGFFRSLELVQKNLESLLARAESAEQRLRNLMLQPGVEKTEQYTAAALLLGEGQGPERVASMLNLPLPQVQIVQELQKIASKERKAGARKKRETDTPLEEPAMALPKSAAPREKNAGRPILLVDVIRNSASAQASAHSDDSLSQKRERTTA
jgi:hypothetical protein